jgi:hypothetical protein
MNAPPQNYYVWIEMQYSTVLNTTEGKNLKDLGIKIDDDLPKYIKENV